MLAPAAAAVAGCRNNAVMSVHGFLLPPRISLEELMRSAAPMGSLKRKALAEPDRHTNKGLPWKDEEHAAFLEGLQRFGRGSWLAISRHCVPTRNPTQIASHAQKYFLRQRRGATRGSRFSRFEGAVAAAQPGAQVPVAGELAPEESSSDGGFELFRQHASRTVAAGGTSAGGVERLASNAMLELSDCAATLWPLVAQPSSAATLAAPPLCSTVAEAPAGTERAGEVAAVEGCEVGAPVITGGGQPPAQHVENGTCTPHRFHLKAERLMSGPAERAALNYLVAKQEPLPGASQHAAPAAAPLSTISTGPPLCEVQK